jgi:hypothetical protein
MGLITILIDRTFKCQVHKVVVCLLRFVAYFHEVDPGCTWHVRIFNPACIDETQDVRLDFPRMEQASFQKIIEAIFLVRAQSPMTQEALVLARGDSIAFRLMASSQLTGFVAGDSKAKKKAAFHNHMVLFSSSELDLSDRLPGESVDSMRTRYFWYLSPKRQEILSNLSRNSTQLLWIDTISQMTPCAGSPPLVSGTSFASISLMTDREFELRISDPSPVMDVAPPCCRAMLANPEPLVREASAILHCVARNHHVQGQPASAARIGH